jgi:penicillin-binding protein 1C
MIKFISFITLLLVAGLIGAGIAFPLPDKIAYSTIMTDDQGEVIHAFLSADDKWRMKTAPDEISPLLHDIIVKKEDKYFYYHLGINPFALLRAAFNNVLHLRRTSGASTITMQVARALEPKSRTYTGKFIELFRTVQLEWKYSKAEILQMYCNLLPYGGNIEGVKAASLLYFKKNPDHLSLGEIAALCVIPNRPSSLIPGKNNAAIGQARNRLLRRFEAESVFTSQQIADALTEPFAATRSETPRLVPHLAELLRKTGGPVIHSTININQQKTIETIAADYARSLKLKNINNVSVVVIKNETHQIVSYLGSSDFYDSVHNGQVDGAAAIREPGSTLKPLLYGLCIDQGLLTPKAIITDINVNYNGYAPENYNKHFNGDVTMEYSLAHSLNIPAVKSLRMLGKEKMIAALASCNFRQIKKDRHKLGLSLILGGCGATLTELTGLYSAFANGGNYVKPTMTTGDGKSNGYEVLSPAAAFMINETLSKIDRPDFPLNWQSTAHLPKLSWKTGTSYGRRDAWSIGYNKKYTVGIWCGNFSGKGTPDLSGAEIATPLLFRIFNTIDYSDDQEWFTEPAGVDLRLVCPATGLPPSDQCTNTVSDYFIPMVSSNKICDHLAVVMMSADKKISYCNVCAPANGYIRKWIRNISPEMQHYYAERKIVFEKIPPHNPACEKVFSNQPPEILAPADGMDILVSKKDPEPVQLKCRTPDDVNRIFWYINNHFYKSCDAGTTQFFVPDEGPVKISCTDDKGRNKDVWINVRYADL